MKNAAMIFLSVVVFVGIFSGSVFAQNTYADNYRKLMNSAADRMEYIKNHDNDKNDRCWGRFDWRYREINAGHVKKFGFKRYEPKTLYEWLDDTRQTFKKADALLTAKDEKDYLEACRKMREAGIITEAFCYFSPPEVVQFADSGPFISIDGRRDHQFLYQLLAIKSYVNYFKTGDEFQKVRSRTSEKAQANALIALFTVRGVTYEVDRYKLWLKATNRLPDWQTAPSEYTYACKGGTPDAETLAWQKLFACLLDSNLPTWTTTSEAFSNKWKNLKLVLRCGDPFGSPFNQMITGQDFAFIERQTDQAWKDLLEGREEITKNLPRFTYWKRDADSGEPALILKVRADKRQCFEGNIGGIIIHYHLPSSFLRGLCPEWKAEMAGLESCKPNSDTEKIEIEIYNRYFARERLKWYKITAEEYAKLKDIQEQWEKAHNTEAFRYKQNLCANFQRLSQKFDDCSTTSGSYSHKYSLEALEAPAPTEVDVVVSRR